MTHTAVVDLGYGDAGKGTVVDWLCATQPVHAVVRFSGGAQAAHNVVLPDDRHHTFAQFGSGTFHSTPAHPIETFLSRFMLVEPFALAAEAGHLEQLGVPNPLALLRVDGDALLTTPYHAALNRARELARGPKRHGSCGIGVGETTSWSLTHPDAAPRVRDSLAGDVLRDKLVLLRDYTLTEQGKLLGTSTAVEVPPVEAVASALEAFGRTIQVTAGPGHLADLLRAGPVVFEGSQGVLLDEWRGFHPHTTWSTTTFENVETLVDEADLRGTHASAVTKVGVVRTYTTRHGAGPLVTEDPALAEPLAEPHNGTSRWQGDFRVGHFDAVAHRYALEVCGGVDMLALTHLDSAGRTPQLGVVDAYSMPGRGTRVKRLVPSTTRDLEYQAGLTAQLADAHAEPQPVAPGAWIDTVEQLLGAPVGLTSEGPTWRDKVPTGAVRAA